MSLIIFIYCTIWYLNDVCQRIHKRKFVCAKHYFLWWVWFFLYLVLTPDLTTFVRINRDHKLFNWHFPTIVCIQRHKFVLSSIICCCFCCCCCCFGSFYGCFGSFYALKLETITNSLHRQLKCDFLPIDNTKHRHGIYKILIITSILRFFIKVF
jgi:hypothetical protein